MRRTLTRKDFLKLAGTGATGATLLGASALSSGCSLQPDRGTRTNVVVVILDSLRKDHVGAYGNDWIKTPNLDALARESLRFSRAYPESLPTICARRAIHTGMRTWPFRDWEQYKGVDVVVWGWQPIPEGQTTLAEILKENGYETLFVTDNLHQYKPSMNFQQGFDVFDFIRGQTTDSYRPKWTDPREKVRQALVKGQGFDVKGQMRRYFANTAYRKTEEDWFSPRVFTGAMELLEAASEGGPFFLVVDNYDPHQPWDPPEEYVSLYDDPYDGLEPYMPVGQSSNLTDRQLERMKALYAAEVTMVDTWLGNFLEKMDTLGLSENTLLLLISDHGVAHGEHGITGKPPYALWPEVTDIPFFIRHPDGKGAGEASDHYASTHDVAPTILGFLGIESPQPMDGQDLTVLLDGEEPDPRHHFVLGFHDHAWARDERYVMFSRYDGTEAKLYDVREDPGMRHDLSGMHPDVVKRMFGDYVLEEAGGSLPTYGF
ncbi:MAG: sulfatase [Actinobacteria bacterium]|nr:sulfatase [Actinomycetota bacterium]